MQEALGSPKCASECTVPVTRLSKLLLNITLNSQSTSYLAIHLTDKPQVSQEVFFGGRERKGRTAIVIFPLPKCQLHLTLYPYSSFPSSPSWAQLWLSHTLDRGHFPAKFNSIFQTSSSVEQ